MVQPSQEVEPRRELCAQFEPLGLGAQVGQIRGEVPGVVEPQRRVQEGVYELQVDGDPRFGWEAPGVATTAEGVVFGFPVGAQPQASPGRPDAGSGTGRAVAAAVGMAGGLGRQHVVGVWCGCEHGADAGVQHGPPRRRQTLVGRRPHQIMVEVVRAVGQHLQHPVVLHLPERLDQFLDRTVHHLSQDRRVRPPAEGGEPRHEHCRLGAQAAEAVAEQGVETARQRVVAPGQPPGHLHGEKRVAVAGLGDQSRIGAGRDGVGERGDRLGVKGSEGDRAELVVAAQGDDETARRQVGIELGNPGRGHQRHRIPSHMSGHVMQQRRRRRVEPVEVVEQHGDRRVGGHGRDRAGHRVVQPCRVVDLGALTPELGEQGDELATDGIGQVCEVDGPQGVDPGPERPPRLSFVAATGEDDGAGGDGREVRLLEEAGLADAGLTLEQAQARRLATPGGIEVPEHGGALAIATGQDRRHGCGTSGARAGGVRARKRRCGEPIVEGRVLGKDGLLQLAQTGRRLQSELVGHRSAGSLKGPERVRLPPGQVEGEHQQPPELLPEGVSIDRGLEARDRLAGTTGQHLCLELQLDRLGPQGVELGDGGPGERFVRDVNQRIAPPQTERSRAVALDAAGIAGQPSGPCPLDQVLKPVGVGLARLDSERIAGAHRLDGLWAQDPAQGGDVVLEDARSRGGWALAPEVFDEAVPADRATPVDQKVEQQRPLLGALRLDPLTGTVHLERPEDPIVDGLVSHRARRSSPAHPTESRSSPKGIAPAVEGTSRRPPAILQRPARSSRHHLTGGERHGRT